MAGQVGFGIGFDFNALDKATAKADEDLKQLANGAEEQARRIQRAFSLSATMGLNQFAKEITNVYGDLSKFSQYANMEFKLSISKHTSGKVINEINDIVNMSRKKFEELNAIKLSGVIDPSILNNVKELEAQLARLQGIMKTGGIKVDENTFVRLSMENRVAVADEIKAIQERLSVMRMSTTEFNKMKSDEVAAVIKNAQAEENAYNDKLKRIEQEKKAYNEKVEAYRKMFDEIDKMESRTRQANYKTKMSSGGVFQTTDVAQNAISYMNRIYSDKGVLSIQNMEKALSKLRDAQGRLNLNTEEGRKKYAQVSDAIKRVEKDLEKAAEKNKRLTDESKKLKNEHNALLETAKKLTTRFAQLFSVQAITGYIKKIIQVRGEFEMQHRAMQVLIGDVDKANELWDKTVSLAVKSPFKVRDLVTYTKQLSAYRIETDKLYDKTKMLADISSGLGVDMNRLILAYGQVKAANYLRGTELRQFSEAGINVLGELATYFSEIEGRAISVGDVFDRVSKRMVSFADVDAVLQRVTSESGAFYQMQEKQSQTLKGMMLNLTDTVELMMNDLGKRNDGVLKGSIKLIKELVDNWRKLEPVIAAAGTALLSYFPLKAIGNIGKALATIPAAFAAHPVAIAIAGAAAIYMAIHKIITAQTKLNAAMTEVDANITSSLEESIALYHELTEATNDATKSTEERNKAYDKLKDKFSEILPDQMTERSYIEALAGDYKAAEDAMMSYYNAKAVQQKKDKVESMFQAEIYDTDIPELQASYKKQLKKIFDSGNVTADEYIKLDAGLHSSVLKAVESAKNGEIKNTMVSLRNEIEKNLAEFAGIDQSALDKHLGIKITEDLLDAVNTINRYHDAISDVEGLPFRTYDEKVAAKDKAKLNEQFEFVKQQYSKLANLYKKVADEKISLYTPSSDETKEEIRKGILRDLDLIYSEVERKYPAYTKLLKDVELDLINSAKNGTYEFVKLLPSIESSLYTREGGLSTYADKMAEEANMAGNKAAETLFDNFAETTKKEGTKKLRGALQNSIVNAIDYAIKSHNLDDESEDFMAKIIPDTSKSTADVRNNIEGIINQFNQLKKEYDIATKAGATELPFVEWLSKDGASQTSRSMDTYLYGSAEILARNEKLIPALTTVFKLLGGEFKGKKKQDNLWDERIKVIDQMNKKFEELSKTLTNPESIDGAFEAYKDAFQKAYAGTSFVKGQNVKQMTAEEFVTTILNFPDKNAIVDFLDELADTAVDLDDKIKAELKKGEYVEEIRVKISKEDQEKTIKDIEDMFGSYDVSLEMEKLNIPPDLAKQLFGVDAISLKDIKDEITAKLGAARIKGGQEDYIKELEKSLKKAEELEDKYLKDRAKEYIKYLRTEQDERIKLKMSEIQKLADIERMYQEGLLTKVQADAMTGNVRKETTTAVEKSRWKDFEKSAAYLQLFDNISESSTYSLEKMKQNLEELRKSMMAAGIPASDLKEILSQIENVEDELENRNPFGEAWNNLKTLLGGYKDYRRARKEEKVLLEEETRLLKEKKALEDAVAAEQKQGGDTQALARLRSEEQLLATLTVGTEEYERQLDLIEHIKNNLYPATEEYNNIDKALDSTQERLSIVNSEVKKWKEATREIAEGFENAGNTILNITSELSDTLVKTGHLTEENKDIVDSMLNVGGDIVGAGSDVLKLVTNPADLQAWVGLITSSISLVGNLAETSDAKRQKEINAEAEKLERLEKSYERLETAMNEAYSTSEVNRTYDDASESINAQIAALEKQKALEESKKNSDTEALKGYSDAIDELILKKEELERERAEKHGANFDVGSIAESFVDAWTSAFEETGDGLKGLEEEWDEFYQNLIKQQAAKRYVKSIIGPLIGKINEDLADGVLDKAEELQADANNVLGIVDKYMQNINQIFGAFGNGEVSMSGLSEGISGMTEDQANILAAYWNAVRGNTASIDLKLDTIIANMNAGGETNPMVTHLANIAQDSAAIRELLNGITYEMNGFKYVRM